MRLSSLSLAAVLLFPSIAFAQHHEAGSGPSGPPPSAAPSPSPSSATVAPAPSPASISTGAPSVGVFHASAASTPAAASVPEGRVAPTSGSTVRQGSISPPTESRSGSTATSAARDTSSGPGCLIPDQRISGETKIVSVPRIGQNSMEREPEMKPGPPGHRICDNRPCEEEGTEWRADPPRSDLRRRICPNGQCPCPLGKVAEKGGCAVNPPPVAPAEVCQTGGIWNGAVCAPSHHCAPGERWNGVSCVASAAECSSLDGRPRCWSVSYGA